ncbi:hydrogenase maturation protease [Candidatus Bipolaricaulota bacterium]|nr:hydrogenase maturation protease [Candidatus Bipolaricaulota bacterium]MBS3825758.1 hydrogenase maturation protease [Candidatus Bipolaricaulota bacterium]
MGKLGVLGIGNTLKGDDGIGVMLVKELKKEEFPGEVEFHEVGTSGMNILHYLEGLDKAVIVDALRSGGNPGDSIFFRPEEVDKDITVRSTHDANLLEAIELSETLGERPEKIVIMGVIPDDMTIRDGLSPLLENKLPDLVKKLREKIISLIEEEGGTTPPS